jgi:hypothetical protein
MEKDKLILLQIENEFYLQVPEEIYLDKYREDIEGNMLVLNYKYHYFAKDKDVNYTKDFHNIGYANFDGSINIIYLKDDILIIPKDIFKIHKDNFNKLRKILKKYDDIFDVELREYYSNNNFKNTKIKIEYEVIKLENPIKNKNHLFRLKNNNIPKDWVEQSKYLIKKLEYPNSRYGNISEGKINLINYNGYIPKNIDFIISEEYAKRLDELFKSWNNENIRSKKIKLIEYLFKTYNDVKSYKDNYFVSVDDKITVLVDVENLEILEFKSLYYNNGMESYNKLVSCVNNIQKEIDKINEKSVDNV